MLQRHLIVNGCLQGIKAKAEATRVGIAEALRIYITTLEQAHLPEARYDFIMMNHVLEHMPNPREITEIAFRLLKPGGYFCGLLARDDCLEQSLFKHFWQKHHLPRHLIWFSKKQLSALLKQFCFNDIRCTRARSWQASNKNLLYTRGASQEKISILNRHNVVFYVLIAPLTITLVLIGKGPLQKFIARKPLA